MIPHSASVDGRCQRWYPPFVVKTTVYLPEDLHAAVKRVAAETASSEAEVIRTAIRELDARRRASPARRSVGFLSGPGGLAERVDELLDGDRVAPAFGER